MKDDYADLDEYAKTRVPVYGNATFEGIMSILVANLLEKLDNLCLKCVYITVKFYRIW